MGLGAVVVVVGGGGGVVVVVVAAGSWCCAKITVTYMRPSGAWAPPTPIEVSLEFMMLARCPGDSMNLLWRLSQLPPLPTFSASIDQPVVAFFSADSVEWKSPSSEIIRAVWLRA